MKCHNSYSFALRHLMAAQIKWDPRRGGRREESTVVEWGLTSPSSQKPQFLLLFFYFSFLAVLVDYNLHVRIGSYYGILFRFSLIKLACFWTFNFSTWGAGAGQVLS